MTMRLNLTCPGLRRAAVVCGALLAGWATVAEAQQVDLATEAYIEPSEPILEAVTAPWHENVTLSNLSPDGTHFLITLDDGMAPLERLARPYVNLGEETIDHIANRSRRTTTRNSPGLELRTVEGNETRPIQTPAGARVSDAGWSPDGSMVAYFAHTEDATHIYVAEAATGRSRQVTRQPVNAVHVDEFHWSGDSTQVLAVLVPEGRGEMPQPPAVATEPQVRINRDGRTPTRLYRFLMTEPYDFELYEWLSTSQLALVNVDDRTVTEIGEPAMFTDIDLSPSADLVEVTTILKPFVYHSPAGRFGSLTEIWNADGEVIHELRRRELEGDDDDESLLESGWQGSGGLWPGDVVPGEDLHLTGEQQGRRRFGGGGDDDVTDEMRDIEWRPDGQGISFLQLEPRPEEDEEDDQDQADDDDDDDAADANRARGGGAGDDQPQQRTRRRGGRRGQQTGDRQLTFLGIPIRAGQDEQAGDDDEEADEEEPPRKDRLMQWVAPYGDEDKQVVYETEGRINGVEYNDDCRILFITETKDDDRISFALDLDDPDGTKHIYRGGDDDDDQDNQRGGRGRGGQDDAPGRTGSLMTRPGPMGMDTVRMSIDGASIYFTGTLRPDDDDDDDDDEQNDDEQTGDNPRPFIDRYELATGDAERIFVTDGTMSERITAVQGDDITAVFTSRESETVIPDTWRYDLTGDDEEEDEGDEGDEDDDDRDNGDDDDEEGDDGDDGPARLTSNVDYLPDITSAKRDRFQVTRVDGYTFWVEVTIPRDYGKELPAMFWFYPREYTSQQQYDQRASRGGRGGGFPRIRQRSMEILTRLGYVVVEPDLPIFGEEGRMNDNYVQDLRNGLWAVIDELDQREIIDRNRIGIGGHSYGAFGTANAMVHTPFFRAGIAGDGNYNRTLTPMAFQSERRFLWDARETYFAMSPLLWANQLNGALLMYHGIEDPNTGTHPFHAIRMFEVLDGLGKDVSLYRYHYEEHGPLARETTLDLWGRWEQWLEKFVKRAGEADE